MDSSLRENELIHRLQQIKAEESKIRTELSQLSSDYAVKNKPQKCKRTNY
jgi:hypothetical protein